MPYTIRSQDGSVVIAQAVSKEQLLWLRGLDAAGYRRQTRFGEPVAAMIRVSRRSDEVWLALVEESIIKAEIRREIRDTIPVAAANRTLGRVEYVDRNGRSGWYFEHRNKRAYSYLTTQASASELSGMVLRQVVGELARGNGTVNDFVKWFAYFCAQQPAIESTLRVVRQQLTAYEHGRLTDAQLIEGLQRVTSLRRAVA